MTHTYILYSTTTDKYYLGYIAKAFGEHIRKYNNQSGQLAKRYWSIATYGQLRS